MDYSLLIGGLGIGSLLTSAVSHILSRGAARRDRLYAEKRETFLGLLDALREASLSPSPGASKAYGLWHARCELFASRDVANFARDLMDGPPKDKERNYEGLLEAMRKDLRHHS